MNAALYIANFAAIVSMICFIAAEKTSDNMWTVLQILFYGIQTGALLAHLYT